MITPIEHYPALAKALGIKNIYFKREDLHPFGSHKGRSIPYMIEHYYKNGDRKFAISSSGNAALAAMLFLHSKEAAGTMSDIELNIFVGNNVSAHKLVKLRALENEKMKIFLKERPLQALMQAIQDGYRSLRQSTDDLALEGYKSLAQEFSLVENIGAIFIGTSSGTTAQSLAMNFSQMKMPVQMHVIQTSSCHPISDAFDTFDIPKEKSIADAIVDQTAIRKQSLIKLINESGGRGWCATNEELKTAQELTKKYTDLDISTNSALSVVGAMQAAYMGFETSGSIVCMICGD